MNRRGFFGAIFGAATGVAAGKIKQGGHVKLANPGPWGGYLHQKEGQKRAREIAMSGLMSGMLTPNEAADMWKFGGEDF